MVVNKAKGTVKNQEPPKSDNPERSPKPRLRKSPGRSTSATRSTSPSRKRSPGRRSPARTKKDVSPAPIQSSTPKGGVPTARSPIRRSPSRKSPTRTVKTVTKTSESYSSERVMRPRRQQPRLEIESDSDTPDGDIFLHSDKPHAAVKGRARRLEVQVEKLNVETTQPRTFNMIRRVTQNSLNREVDRVVHVDNVAKLGEFSDEDEIGNYRKSVSAERGGEFKPITEFGGPWGALFYILVTPITIIALLISCNEYQCSFVKIPDYKKYLLLSTYFDLSAILGFIGYAVTLALLSVIPFGGKHVVGMPTKQGKYPYIMNGLFSCSILIAIMAGLEWRKIPITEFIVKHLFHLLIASILVGFFLTTYAYIRSFYVFISSLNAHVVGRSKIYGFFMGRELNPRAFGLLDLKMYVFRLALIGSVLLDVAILSTTLNWTSIAKLDLVTLNINPTLLVLVLIHTIYYLDALAHEPAFVTSFEIQYEGFGYMSGVGYLIYPFMMASVTKYVVDYDVHLAIWKLLLTGLIFGLGYVLFRGSNNQKDAFRKNPYDPALSFLETIPTTKGKKLICSGFWGVVRHPNYLGDILMNLAFIPFALDVPPVLSAISIILFLIHRSVRDNIRCKQKYGAAWDRYCNKVKYVLLPKVY